LELAKKDLEILIKEKNQSLSNTTSSKTTTIKNTEDSFKTYIAEIDKIITEADYVL
jgi:ATP-dependent protease HslVU (ClpYQ) ATPase subunit